MRFLKLFITGLLLAQVTFAQDSPVETLFDQISAVGKEYQLLKNEKDPKKIAVISERVTAISNKIRQTEITGVDSILFNIHEFSAYLAYYSDFINNPIQLPDSLRPAQVFRSLDSTALFLKSFDTIGYDTEFIEELYFPDTTGFSAENIGEFASSENKGLSGIASSSEAQVNALSKMAGLGCCRIRVKVRVRVVIDKPKKTYDKVVHTLQDAVNTVGRFIPAEVKELGVKVFAAALEVEGKYIHFLNDLNQRVFSVTFETFEFLRSLQEKTDKELIKAASNLMNTAGLKMPKEIEDGLIAIATAKSNVLRETMAGFSKAMELNYNINAMTADALLLFSKYLLLAGTDFPPFFERPKPNISAADAYVTLNISVVQKAIDRLFSRTIDLDTARHKGFKMILDGSEHKLSFDEKSGCVLIELGDFNVKGMYLLGGMADLMAPSATINIKKAKIQLIPDLEENENTIHLRPRLYYLDVKGVMPLFDRLIAWAIEKNFLEDKALPIALDSALNDEFKFRGANPASVALSFGQLKDYSINNNQLTLALNTSLQNEGHINKAHSVENGVGVEISEHFMASILRDAIASEGIRFSLKKDMEDDEVFDPSYNHLHLKKLHELKMENDRILVDVNTQVHLRRFLGRKPKLNFEVTHAAFYLTPVLGKNDEGEPVLKLMMLPAVDKIELKNLNKKFTRKALKVFKQDKKERLFAEVKLESLQSIEFENPFKKGENLLDPFKELVVKIQQGRMIIALK
ncbi:MAG: hypothetical protein WCF67_08760 [Chitinophagaceae bacterium]